MGLCCHQARPELEPHSHNHRTPGRGSAWDTLLDNEKATSRAGGVLVAFIQPTLLVALYNYREGRESRDVVTLAVVVSQPSVTSTFSPVNCLGVHWIPPFCFYFPDMFQMGLSTSTQSSLRPVRNTPMGSWCPKLLGTRKLFRKGKVKSRVGHTGAGKPRGRLSSLYTAQTVFTSQSWWVPTATNGDSLTSASSLERILVFHARP